MREPHDHRSAFHWQMRAEEMRTLADNARHPDNKLILLAIALEYERLAQCAENDAVHNAAMTRIAAGYDRLAGRAKRDV